MFSRHDRCICALIQGSRELHMASLLADFDKTGGFRRRLISRKLSGLSRPNFHFDMPHDRRVGRNGRFKVQFQCFAKVGERLVFCLALTRHIDLQALGAIQSPSRQVVAEERTFHDSIFTCGPETGSTLGGSFPCTSGSKHVYWEHLRGPDFSESCVVLD